MIKAIAIDNNVRILDLLKEYFSGNNIAILQKAFTKASEAIKYLNKFPVDLILLDIEMLPALQKQLSVTEQEIMIIVTADNSHNAIEGFNIGALDFLLKPFSFDRFLIAVNRAQKYFRLHEQNKTPGGRYLFVRSEYSLVKIDMLNILYIEGLDDYLAIHLTNQQPVIAKLTMKSVLEKLPPEEFIRVHRSFIVPLRMIKEVRKKTISIGDKVIPIGTSYEEHFLNIFKG